MYKRQGVFSVWLKGFLSPKRDQPAYVTLSGLHLYPQEVSGELAYTSAKDPQLAEMGNRLMRGEEPEEGGKE